VARKVSHYQETSLNHIKTVSEARFFISIDYKMSKRILYVGNKYSMTMFGLICDIISCCVWSAIRVNWCI